MGHLAWVDFVRVIAALFVVLVHAAAPWVLAYGKTSAMNWQTANLTSSVVRVAVPLFCMVSGFLLLPKAHDLDSFLKRRLSRLLTPLVAWAVIYFLYRKFHGGEDMPLRRYLVLFYHGDVYYHMWFLFMLLGMYFCMPVLSPLVMPANRHLLNYYLVGWCFVALLCPAFGWVMRFFFHQDWVLGIDMPVFAGYSGYFLIGHLLGVGPSTQKNLGKLGLFFCLSVLATAMTNTIASMRSGHLDGWNGYISPFVLVSSVLAFAGLKEVGARFCVGSRLSRIIVLVGRASLGIYLVHPLVMEPLQAYLKAIPGAVSEMAAFNIPLVAVLTFLGSFIIVSCMIPVPFVKRIVL